VGLAVTVDGDQRRIPDVPTIAVISCVQADLVMGAVTDPPSRAGALLASAGILPSSTKGAGA